MLFPLSVLDYIMFKVLTHAFRKVINLFQEELKIKKW